MGSEGFAELAAQTWLKKGSLDHGLSNLIIAQATADKAVEEGIHEDGHAETPRKVLLFLVLPTLLARLAGHVVTQRTTSGQR